MGRTARHPLVRAVTYAAVATVLAVAIGTLSQGSLGGGLALGVAVGVGVAVGLLGFEFFRRYRES